MIAERDAAPADPASKVWDDDDPAADASFADPSLGDLERDLAAAVGLGNDPGLGLLVELARKGEADPWDVDIVSLTDSYLVAMDEVLDARDLGRVARLIFYAACLIHLKAQAMAAQQRELDYDQALEQTLAEDLDGGWGLSGDGWRPQLRPDDMPLDYGFLRHGAGVDPALFLSPREQPLRARGLTLVDLIRALRDYDDRLAHRDLLASEPDFDAEQALVECVGSSHQDDLDQDVIDVRLRLWDLLGKDQPEGSAPERVTLDELIEGHRTRAAAFLALLFLAQDEEILLEQTEAEFYGPLFVARGPHFGEIRAGVVLPGERPAKGEDDDEDDGPGDEFVEHVAEWQDEEEGA
ncbi:MAG: segregation/condensation protein A [Planctomycetota bacterium]